MNELTQIQNSVLILFSKSELQEQFYWTGGTFLSVIHLHHRRSEDLDFFSDVPFSYDKVRAFINDCSEKLRLKFIEQKKIFDRWEFFLHNNDQLRIEFVHYNFPRLRLREKWHGVITDSLDDVAANKLMAFFDRNEPKDLFDLYFLFTRAGYSPDKLVKMVGKKFGVRLSQSAIWSEAFKSMKNLENLTPLLTQKGDQGQKILDDIRHYFEKHSRTFLDTALE